MEKQLSRIAVIVGIMVILCLTACTPEVGYRVRVTAAEAEVKILSYKIEHEYGGWPGDWLIVYAKNVSGRRLGWVGISARLLDKDGIPIDATVDSMFDVFPDMIFEFTLWIGEPERTKTIEIYEITELDWNT